MLVAGQEVEKHVNVDYKSLAQQVFEEHNKVRANPKSYIPYLQDRLKYFKGNILNLPGEIGLMTQEGPSAYQECINYLETAPSIGKLEWCSELAQASQDHANDTGPKGITGHNGTDGCSMQDRIERYGQWEGTIGENIDYGGAKEGKDVLLHLMIDDGVSTRGHRKNIFNPEFKMVGIACGPHTTYKSMCVLDYAGGMHSKGTQGNTGKTKEMEDLNQKKPVGTQGNTGKTNEMEDLNQKKPVEKQKSKVSQEDESSDPVDYTKKSVSTNTKTQISGNKKTVTTTIKTTYTLKDGSIQEKTETIVKTFNA